MKFLFMCFLVYWFFPGPIKNANRRFEAIRANRSHVVKIVSQRQSITRKGVHTHPLTAREREHWFSKHLSHFTAVNVGSANTLLCDTLALSQLDMFLRIDSRESIRATRPDARCESPGHLR